MLIKNSTKERIDRLFDNQYGIIRFKKFALVKNYSYKYMIKELLWGILEIPVALIVNVVQVVLYMFNFIPRIYIEKEEENI